MYPAHQHLLIANASGFWGDRPGAAADMVRGGPIDVLTGEYLAELTMAILQRKLRRDPQAGYVTAFLDEMTDVLGECLDRGIRIVTNAGGLNPGALAERLHELAARLGVPVTIATLDGDDLLPRLKELQAVGEPFRHLDRGTPLSQARAATLSANAYLGGWGIAEALRRGAHIVVTGRVADAALVVGPAAWRFGWRRDEWDKIAGAIVAGHILECGPQATGGNYPFLDEIASFERIGFPIAELHADGSCVITKHPHTGGAVTVGTVTAQLLYEIQSERYFTPDGTARFDTIALEQVGVDRVRVSGARGEPPPPTAKVTINNFGGYRNSMTVLLTGLEIARKAQIVEAMLFEALGGKAQFANVHVQLIRSDKPDAPRNEEAFAYLRIAVQDMDEQKVGRRFSNAVIALALASIPGFAPTSPPGDAQPSIVHWPALVAGAHVPQYLHLDAETVVIPWLTAESSTMESAVHVGPSQPAETEYIVAPLGTLYGARSGDKGGNANLGVWARTPEAYGYLFHFLTADKLAELLPDMGRHPIVRHELPNILALNFIISGVLGDGVASSVRLDPQAKTLGEYFRARHAPLPAHLVQAAQRRAEAAAHHQQT